MNASELLMTNEAARFLGIKPATLRVWRMSGKGPAFVRIGEGQWARAAYRRGDLEAWIASRVFRSTADESEKRRAAGSAA